MWTKTTAFNEKQRIKNKASNSEVNAASIRENKLIYEITAIKIADIFDEAHFSQHSLDTVIFGKYLNIFDKDKKVLGIIANSVGFFCCNAVLLNYITNISFSAMISTTYIPATLAMFISSSCLITALVPLFYETKLLAYNNIIEKIKLIIPYTIDEKETVGKIIDGIFPCRYKEKILADIFAEQKPE